jgi:hypothetical protein
MHLPPGNPLRSRCRLTAGNAEMHKVGPQLHNVEDTEYADDSQSQRRKEPGEEREDRQGFLPSIQNIKSEPFLQKSFVIEVAGKITNYLLHCERLITKTTVNINHDSHCSHVRKQTLTSATSLFFALTLRYSKCQVRRHP